MRLGLVAALAIAGSGRLAAQGPGVDVGAAVTGVASEPGYLGVGPVVRIGWSRELAVLVSAGAGRRGDRWAGRGEAAIQVRFPDRVRRGRAWYLAGGVAGVTGAERGGYLLAGLGLERPASRTTGWWVELGVGGGARLVAGFRSRVRTGNDKRPP